MQEPRRCKVRRLATNCLRAVAIVAWLGAVCPAPVAGGAEQGDSSAPRGVLRVINQLSEKEICLGSGTLIERQQQAGVVLTCAHLFGDGVGELYVAAPGSRPQRAVLVAKDDANDLACLVVHQPSMATVPVAGAMPKIGDRLASWGFGQHGVLEVNRGKLLGLASLDKATEPGLLELAGNARQGDSGGPIVDRQGQLVAVIIGTDGSQVDGTHCDRIRKFLAAHRATTTQTAEAARLASRPPGPAAVALAPGTAKSHADHAERPRTGRIRGRVLLGSRAWANTKIRLSGAADRTLTSDANGRFETGELPAGNYKVAAETVAANTTRRATRVVVVPAHEQEIVLSLE